jgi:hypothetical protein
MEVRAAAEKAGGHLQNTQYTTNDLGRDLIGKWEEEEKLHPRAEDEEDNCVVRMWSGENRAKHSSICGCDYWRIIGELLVKEKPMEKLEKSLESWWKVAGESCWKSAGNESHNVKADVKAADGCGVEWIDAFVTLFRQSAIVCSWTNQTRWKWGGKLWMELDEIKV